MEMMHRKKVESSPTMVQIMNELKHNYNAEISINDFCKWTNNNSSMLSPLIVLQLKFRKQLLGESYWGHKSDLRQADSERGSIEYIRNLNEDLRKKAAEAKAKRDLEAQANQVKSRQDRMTDAQRNVARKQSVLLRAFNMVPNKRDDSRGAQVTEAQENAIVGSKKKQKPLASPDSSPSKNTVVPTAGDGIEKAAGGSSSKLQRTNTNSRSEFDSPVGNELKSRPSSSKSMKKQKSVKYEADSKDGEIGDKTTSTKKNRPKSGKSGKNKSDGEKGEKEGTLSRKSSSKNNK
jgi:hypothetical protein